MSLANIKIKVHAANCEHKIRCCIAESIASMEDIRHSVLEHFGGVEVVEIFYRGQFNIIYKDGIVTSHFPG